tara:strand:+ start:148 stop:378 length:231 start_codon:yes stop_codon:yes gene_type:complete
MEKERELDMVDFESVVESGVLLMSSYDDGDGGVEVYEEGGMIYLFSYDWGGSLCGEERFDSIEEMKSEIDDVEWSI